MCARARELRSANTANVGRAQGDREALTRRAELVPQAAIEAAGVRAALGQRQLK